MNQVSLAQYLAAGYSGIHLRTDDIHEARCFIINSLKSVELAEGDRKVTMLDRMTIYEWEPRFGGGRLAEIPNDYADGVYDDDEWESESKTIDDMFIAMEEKDHALCIVRNSRSYLEESPTNTATNATTIAAATDALIMAKDRGSAFVFLGSIFKPAQEIDYLITVVDSPYPTRRDIRDKARAMAESAEIVPDKRDKQYATFERSIADAAIAGSGMSHMAVENALSLSIALTGAFDHRIIMNEKSAEIRKSDVLEYFPVDEGLKYVGGMDLLKMYLSKRKNALGEDAEKFGILPPKGILLAGIPGTGKSLVAKAVSCEFGWPCLRLDMGKVFRSYVGQSEAAIRNALQVAEAVSPCVLFIDEIEKSVAGAGSDTDSGTSSRVVSTLLTWRQETTKPVFLACTANKVSAIPPELMRHGRLDAVFFTDTPNYAERAEIFRIHLEKKRRDPDMFDIAELAEQSAEFIGSEIEQCIMDALYSAFDQKTEITTDHILREILQTKPLSVRNAEEVRYIREWGMSRARPVSSKYDGDRSRKKGRVLRTIKN